MYNCAKWYNENLEFIEHFSLFFRINEYKQNKLHIVRMHNIRKFYNMGIDKNIAMCLYGDLNE